MNQDHIKLVWLREYLEKIEFLQQYHWEAYVDEDLSESCIVPNSLHSLDLSYDLLVHINEYTRPISELRRILLNFLNAANPTPHQQIQIHYQHVDADRHNVLVIMAVDEVQEDVTCEESEAEGWVLINGERQPVKLDRHKPDELVELLAIICMGM